MTDNDSYTDIDICIGVENTELSPQAEAETEDQSSELIDDVETSIIEDSKENLEDALVEKPSNIAQKSEQRLNRLPLSRIKNIMKSDPDVNIVTAEAVFVATKATELFLEILAQETYDYMSAKKRKTVTKKDLDHVINSIDCLCFLEGAMDF